MVQPTELFDNRNLGSAVPIRFHGQSLSIIPHNICTGLTPASMNWSGSPWEVIFPKQSTWGSFFHLRAQLRATNRRSGGASPDHCIKLT